MLRVVYITCWAISVIANEARMSPSEILRRDDSSPTDNLVHFEARHPLPLQRLIPTLPPTPPPPLPSFPPTYTEALVSMLPLRAEVPDSECVDKDPHTNGDASDHAEGVDGTKCPSFHDGYACWPSTAPGTYATVPCPAALLAYNSTNYASRLCGTDGKWSPESTDYLPCATDNILQRLGKGREVNATTQSELNAASTLLGRVIQQCVHLMKKPKFPDGVLFCPRTFDGWSCWNDTLAGDTAYSPCPYFITGFDHTRMAHKVCNEDGSWYRHPETNLTWSNYTTCIDLEDLKMRQLVNTIYIAGYSVSLIALVISLVIFFYFSSLQCTRIRLHKNLFVSFILNNVLWIAWYMEVASKPDTVLNNETGCQVLHVLLHYFLVSSYYWMFSEGLYLHTLLVVAFVTEDRLIRWFYLLGWGAPAIIVAIYAGVRGASDADTKHCWINESYYSLILSIPVCLSILANLVFLINIVRVLVTKLRANHLPDEAQGTRKAVRATLILIPLLGLHYVLIPVKPDKGSSGELVYQVIAALASSFQGFCVALLFCFCNSEVIMALKKKWYQYQSIHDHHRFTLSTACALSINGIQSKGAQELRRLSPLRKSRPHSPHSTSTPRHQETGRGEVLAVSETDSLPWSCVVVETRLGNDDEAMTSMIEGPRGPANTDQELGEDEHYDDEADEERATLMVQPPVSDDLGSNDIPLETIEEITED
ncbi:calcitonin gene-related peptide type 1 receptor-like [Macrobrachium rosenbergii]|uniref:calcitonin gene-related peptide type 1 receptor-like n=1 Tax=Macrobrachium rosenbergii TaxID=79674 RepID=UPI0034D735EB